MIVTVTPNPSIDRTVTLGTPLTRGAVHRVTSATSEPGGKGVNVARALTLAGLHAVAVLPAADTDPIVTGLRAIGVAYECVPIAGAVRTNLTITEADGTTTKLNEPGAELDAAALDALSRSVVAHAANASWVVLSGLAPAGRARSLVRRRRRRAGVRAMPGRRRHVGASARGARGRLRQWPRRTSSSRTPRSSPDSSAHRARPWNRLLPRVIRHRWSPRPISSSNAAPMRCSSRSARRARYWSTGPAAGWPHRRPSHRAAPSEPATRRLRVTCAPQSTEPNPPVACRWRSPTAAPLPRCPVPPCRRRRRSI